MASPTQAKSLAAGRPLLVSFSGIDGAGKSTHIEHLRSVLDAAGCRVVQLAFWDDVAVWSRFREGITHKVFKSEKGIGAPGKPVNRRDKNVRSWYLGLARGALYLLDTLHLRRVVARAGRSGTAAIIFDRYVYDELANLTLRNRLARGFLRCVSALAPCPDLAYVIDADPEAAYERKPEYPLEFSRHSRQVYLQLAELLGMVVVPPLPLPEAQREMLNHFQQATAGYPFQSRTQRHDRAPKFADSGARSADR